MIERPATERPTTERPVIERTEELRLTAEREAGIAALLALCFDGFEGRSFFQNRHHVRLTAHEDGALIGHLGLSLRALRVAGALTDVVGIGDVGVHPDHRRRGIGAALVDAAIAEGRRSPARFAVLLGTEAIYAAAGFSSVRGEVTATQMQGARTGKITRRVETALMVRPLRGDTWDPKAPVDLCGWPF